MVSQHVYDLCHQSATVSSELAKNPDDTPANIIKRLYRGKSRTATSKHIDNGQQGESRDTLERAYQCGRWPEDNKPSQLFLKAYADCLASLDSDPMAGVVSPPLMGSQGRVPLTIIAPLVDIIKHCANLIRKARKEVVFTTCVWKPSRAQRLIKEALIDLSKQAGSRGERVRVRMMYAQVGVWNVLDSRQNVKPATYDSKTVQLPTPEEIPNLDFELLGFHTLFLGTLHSKLLVVDGAVAAIMSNNVEDNPNLEMLTQLEGPIVASIRDTTLITWGKPLQDRLSKTRKTQTTQNQIISDKQQPGMSLNDVRDPHSENNLTEEIKRINSEYSKDRNDNLLQAVNHQLNRSIKNPIEPTGPEITEENKMTPYISTMTSKLVPMAMVSRPAYGPFGSGNLCVPQNEAWISLMRNAKHNIFIQSPDLNANSILKALAEALMRGVEVTYYVCFGYNDAGEMLPGQGGTNEQATRRLIASLGKDEQALQRLHVYNYVGKDQDHPIHESLHARTCHIKLLIVDNTVGVQGSANQDTQSWCHSQEINVMIDSPEICELWRWGIEQNQNTKAFGRVSNDGVWRDAEGNPGKGYAGDPGVVDGVLKGVCGMVKKVISL